jgi:hypothetical protein
VTKRDQQGACQEKPRKIPQNFGLALLPARQKNPRGHICRAIGANPHHGPAIHPFSNRSAAANPNELLTIFVQPHRALPESIVKMTNWNGNEWEKANSVEG